MREGTRTTLWRWLVLLLLVLWGRNNERKMLRVLMIMEEGETNSRERKTCGKRSSLQHIVTW